jgi:hypothetical protein
LGSKVAEEEFWGILGPGEKLRLVFSLVVSGEQNALAAKFQVDGVIRFTLGSDVAGPQRAFSIQQPP